MNANEFNKLLIRLKACEEAVNWCNGKSLGKAWDTATNSEWMLWLLYNHPNEATDRELRLIAVKCARQVQHLMTDKRSINALDVAEKFANGCATNKQLYAAMYAAWDAARAAAWDAASDAARAAACVAAMDAQCKIIREYIPEFKIKL